MIKVIVLYGHPSDAAEFDRHYAGVHVPLVQAMPLLRGFAVSRGGVRDGDGQSRYHLVAELSYDNEADLRESLASEPGQRAAADVATFATGGATLLTVEMDTIELAGR